MEAHHERYDIEVVGFGGRNEAPKFALVEDDVGVGQEGVCVAALDDLLEMIVPVVLLEGDRSDDVGARDDLEISVGSGVDGGFDLAAHFIDADQLVSRYARQERALAGDRLIVDVHAGQPHGLEVTHRISDGNCVAVPLLHVRDDGNGNRLGDAPADHEPFRFRHQRQIRLAEKGRLRRIAAHVYGVEAGALDQHRRQGIVGADGYD